MPEGIAVSRHLKDNLELVPFARNKIQTITEIKRKKMKTTQDQQQSGR